MGDTKYSDLDIEWMKLIREALDMGIEKEEIRDFLNSKGTKAVGMGK